MTRPTEPARRRATYSTLMPSINDLRLIAAGRHRRLWEVLGAQPIDAGVRFAVWAPHARGVGVIGDFNDWVPEPMLARESGVWSVLIPRARVGSLYKFRVVGPDGTAQDKADPLARQAEPMPGTASVVTRTQHQWTDRAWIDARRDIDPRTRPMTVYEVHLGSWRDRVSNYRELAIELGAYVSEMGFTHVELLPVTEHPYGGSWGYQVSSYYAPTARYGAPDDFRAFVDHLHSLGISVLMDWVPAHFPKDAWALGRFDGTALYEHADPQLGEHPDWGTYVFDFGSPQVRNFLIANALYWIEEFHVDGLRVDAVSSMLYLDYSRPAGSWTPNRFGGNENIEALEFVRELNDAVHQAFPGVAMIAEESTGWPGVTRPTALGGLGFTLKWNLGWMHDTLGYLRNDPVHRSFHHGRLTSSLREVDAEAHLLPISHDEVVHGKGTLWTRMPGTESGRAANVRAMLAYQWCHPGKQLLFMGQEFGQVREWADDRELDWELLRNNIGAGLRLLVGDLNRLAATRPELHGLTAGSIEWIDDSDAAGNIIAFLRRPDPRTDQETDCLACVFNFSGVDRHDYRVGLPQAGRWTELLNTAAVEYGGSGVGNLGSVRATGFGWHGRPASAAITIPACSAILLTPEPFDTNPADA